MTQTQCDVDITVAATTGLVITIEGGLGGDSPVGVADTCIDGDMLTWTAKFYDETESPAVLTNPDQTAFSYAANGAEPTVLVYGIDEGITNPATGVFVVNVNTTGTAPVGDKAYLVGQFTGAPNEDSDSIICIQDSETVLVLAPKITNPFPAPNPSSTDFDGGNASSQYTPLYNLDGGNAQSTYLADQIFDEGSA